MDWLKQLFKKQDRQSGQAVVELALMLPILILILVGILDLGRIFEAQVTITNAAREGARWAIDHPSDSSGISSHVSAEATAGGFSPVITNPGGLGGSSGSPITVTVTYSFTMLTTNIFAGVSTIPIQSSAVMQIK